MENKTIIRFLVFSGILLSIGFLLSQTVGLGAGGFDTATVLNQFNFYTAGIIYWIIVACFFFALLLMKKGNEYGDSVSFTNQGDYPSLSFFKKLGSFQLVLISLLIFGILGIFIVVTGQRTFTGLRVLEHQFSPVGSILYSSLLIPISENLGAAAVIAAATFLLIVLAIKYDWNKANYRAASLFGIPILVAAYWYVNHLLRYGGSDLSLTVVIVFGLIGAGITLLTGSFIPFWIMHMMNNLLFDLKRHFASEAIRNYMIGAWIVLLIFYIWFYHIRSKKNINNIYK